MIVKHENRIRALEADVALSKSQNQSGNALDDTDGAGGDGLGAAPTLASDEV